MILLGVGLSMGWVSRMANRQILGTYLQRRCQENPTPARQRCKWQHLAAHALLCKAAPLPVISLTLNSSHIACVIKS